MKDMPIGGVVSKIVGSMGSSGERRVPDKGSKFTRAISKGPGETLNYLSSNLTRKGTCSIGSLSSLYKYMFELVNET
jgi:hypothetical protein